MGVRAARDARAALTVLAILAVVVGAPLLYLGWRELDGERGVDQVALQADRLLVPGYVLAGVGVFGLGALFLYGSGARRVARWCAGGVLLVAAADIAENLDPLRGLTGAAGQPASEVATPLAVLKFAVGGPLLPVFVVAGGGYLTGAFQLALTPANPEAESLATAGDVFTPGSAEEDHLRRHGKYLADGGREWLTALGVVLRGVAASLGLLTLGVVVIGVGLNAFYRAAPVVDVTRFLPRFDPASGPEPAPFPAPPAAVWWTLGVGAAIAAAWVVVMVGLLASSDRLGLSRVARNLFRATVGVTAVVVVYAIAVPAVVWAMTRLTWATGVEPGAGRLLHRRRHHPGHLVRRPGRHDVAADREAAGQRGQAGAGRPAGPPGPGRGGRAAGRHRARAAPDRLGGARGAGLRVRVRGRPDDRGRPPLAGLAGPGPAGRAGRGGLPDRPDLAGAAPVLPAPAGLGVRRPPGPHARRRDRRPGLRDRGAEHPQRLRPAGRRVPAGWRTPRLPGGPPAPRQSTGDQFFDHAQFDAYRALGFHIGTAALKAGPG